MEYENFKENLFDGIKNFYGDGVEIVFERVLKNNGQYYDGVRIAYKDSEKIVPVIYFDEIYDGYLNGNLSMKKCVLKVCKLREDSECTQELLAFAEQLMKWETVKDNIYPVLISLEQNQELLQSLVYTQVLDLAVTYVMRVKLPDIGLGTVKISRTILEAYGIDEGQLHETAMHNLKKDVYEFRSMNSIMEKLHCLKTEKSDGIWDEIEKREIYVLSNQDAAYGAAGILNKELIKEFAEGRNFYVIPSSLHETIFMKADSWIVYYNHAVNGCYFNINTPKTRAGKRQIPMLEDVKEAILMEKAYQEYNGIKCNMSVDGYTNFIFVNRFGNLQHQGTLNKALRRIIRDCNDMQLAKGKKNPVLLPNFSCHSLRHTFTTRLVEAGVNIKVIQELCGHTRSDVTLDIYTTVTKELKQREFGNFEEKLNQQKQEWRQTPNEDVEEGE